MFTMRREENREESLEQLEGLKHAGDNMPRHMRR